MCSESSSRSGFEDGVEVSGFSPLERLSKGLYYSKTTFTSLNSMLRIRIFLAGRASADDEFCVVEYSSELVTCRIHRIALGTLQKFEITIHLLPKTDT